MNRVSHLSLGSFPRMFSTRQVSNHIPFARYATDSRLSLSTKSFRKLSSEKAIELSDKYLAPNYANIIPIVASETEGPFITNPEGKKWFDCNGAYSAVNFGHNPEKIITEQMKQAFKSSLPSRAYYNDVLPLVAEKLHRWYDPILEPVAGDQVVKFLPKNTGGEACDATIKLMRKTGTDIKRIRDGEQLILVVYRNFHGRTMGVISASDDESVRKGFAPYLPGFLFCDFNDINGLEKIFKKHAHRICGAMIEYVQGEGGVHVAEQDFLSRLRYLLSENGAMLVADDVQAGFGRTGKISPSEHYENAQPDAVVFAKSFTGGTSPAAGLVARGAWINVMTPGTEGSTFGGNPTSMAAALASMDLYEEIQLGDKMMAMGSKLRETLELWSQINSSIKEVRGLGAMLAVEWKTAEMAKYYQKALRSIGELIGDDVEGITLKLTEEDRTMRINPPLMSEQELDHMIKLFQAVYDL